MARKYKPADQPLWAGLQLSAECVFGKWQKSTLTLLYKGFHSYRWEGCKRIQLIIQLT